MPMQKFPTLYRKTANGSIYFWQTHVEMENNDTYVVSKHGAHEGKVKTAKRKILKQCRENTIFDRGVKIAEKKWKDKMNKEGYVTSLEELESADIFVTPMLAKKVEIKGKMIKGMKFPLKVQPKLDGFRCRCKYSTNNIELFSRKNLPYKGLPTLKSELLKLYETLPENKKKNLHLDGELYIHDVPFEELSGPIKRAQNRQGYDVKNIEFRIYDCFCLDDLKISFNDRTEFIKTIIPINHINLKYVKTEHVNNLEEFKEYYSLFMAEGYEGIMARNPKSPYEISKRSSHLQKYKEFDDDEFEIIGFQEGSGVDEKTVIWKCKTDKGEEFSVRPKGSLEHRRKLFADAKNCIGKLLTVKYQELSEIGVPRFPVGKDIRE